MAKLYENKEEKVEEMKKELEDNEIDISDQESTFEIIRKYQLMKEKAQLDDIITGGIDKNDYFFKSKKMLNSLKNIEEIPCSLDQKINYLENYLYYTEIEGLSLNDFIEKLVAKLKKVIIYT